MRAHSPPLAGRRAPSLFPRDAIFVHESRLVCLTSEGGANPSKRAPLLYMSWYPWGLRDVLTAQNQADVHHVRLMLKLFMN